MSAPLHLRWAAALVLVVLVVLTAPRAAGSDAEGGPPDAPPPAVARFMGRIERYVRDEAVYLDEMVGGGFTPEPRSLFWIRDPRTAGEWFVGYSFGLAGNHQEMCERLARVNRDGIAMEDLSDFAGDEAIVFRLDRSGYAIATVGHGHWGGGALAVVALDPEPHRLLTYAEATSHASHERTSCDSYLLFCDVGGRGAAEIVVRQVEHDIEAMTVTQRYGLYRLATDASRYDEIVVPAGDQAALRARYIAERAGDQAHELVQYGEPWESTGFPDVDVP